MKETLEQKEKNSIRNAHSINHIAIIMDGNRRWAQSKNLPTLLGHREGVQTLKKIMRYADKLGIKYLTVYAFSTENWNRKKEEVDYLMSLFEEALKSELNELHAEGVRFKVIGFKKELPGSLPKILDDATEKTKNNKGLNLQVAFNYGSRSEITHAVKEITKKVKTGELNPEEISEETITNHLFTSGIPEPDLVIRTGGEFRLSNYLLWQSAYSEFYSTEVLWPAFSENDLDEAIKEFNKRKRRFGV